MSPWSPCSTTCGLGVSTRISNGNARCWPEQETRLCDLRPCDLDLRPHIKVGRCPGAGGWGVGQASWMSQAPGRAFSWLLNSLMGPFVKGND